MTSRDTATNLMNNFCTQIITFIVFLSMVIFPSLPVKAQSIPIYDPNFIVSDSTFSSTRVFNNPSSIQTVLNNYNSPLKNYSASGKSAATIIWEAARGISKARSDLTPNLNPGILLAYLEKEMSLLSYSSYNPNTDPEGRIGIAMGYGCPDTASCDPEYFGFINQLNWAAFQLQYNFNNAAAKSSKVLPYIVGTQITTLDEYKVTIDNASTAANYRYTPHVYWGNYNLWKIIVANGWGLSNSTYTYSQIDNANLPYKDAAITTLNENVPFISDEEGLNLVNNNYNFGQVTESTRRLQIFLRQKGYYNNRQINGMYGTMTPAAVKKYKISNKIINWNFTTLSKSKCELLIQSNYNYGTVNSDVLDLQKCLTDVGIFDKSNQTSFYGLITTESHQSAKSYMKSLQNSPINVSDSLFTSHNNTINQYNQQFPASADMKSSQAKYPNINKFYENGGVAELYQRDPFTGEMLNFGLSGGTINKTIRIGYLPEKDWFSNIKGDFNGDGVTDLFWSSPKNKNSAWYFESNSGMTKVQRYQPDAGITDGWRPLCTGRIDQNSTDDILWINKNTNQMYVWLFDLNGNVNRMVALGNLYQDEKVLACGDFNGDSYVDIYTTTTSQNTNRMISFNSEGNNIGSFSNIQNLPLNGTNGGWEAAGVVNNNSNKASVIMRNKTNNDSLKIVSFNSNRTIQSEKTLPKPVSTNSYILTTGDYDGDKIDDIVWRNGDNNLNIWYLNNGGEFASQKVAGTGHYTRLF
jgi:hypothetical protein